MSLLGEPLAGLISNLAQAASEGLPVLHSSLDMLPTDTPCGLKLNWEYILLLVNQYPPQMGRKTEAWSNLVDYVQDRRQLIRKES